MSEDQEKREIIERVAQDTYGFPNPLLLKAVERILNSYWAMPVWKCNNCGVIKHRKEEAICWQCRKGEMEYQGRLGD